MPAAIEPGGAAPPASRLIDEGAPRHGDLATGPAMTVDEARRALDIGAEVAALLVAAVLAA